MAKQSEGLGSKKMSWRVIGWGASVMVLAIPFIAMRFTTEVRWTLSDFVFAAVMFGTVGSLVELAVRTSKSWAYRGGVAAAAFSGLLIIWACGAVGMIGSEGNPYNLWFLAPITVALFGSMAVQFRAAGMARAMLVAAAVHALVALGGMSIDPRGVVFSLLLSTFWLVSASLFRGAEKRDDPAG